MKDLQELPEGCIAHIISLTTPRDACRLSLLSKLFRSAADSDAVWDKFLPPETRTMSPEELGVFAARTKKEVFLALCPVHFREGKLFTARASGFVHLPAEVTMGLEGGEISNRTEFLHSGVRNHDDDRYPKVRSDGWLEIEIGEFFCRGRDDRLLKINCLANGAGHWKRGLIVQGIEVRPKREY
ncbi:hypothetical protein ACLB2K_064693 [Fragaria x ananassa]